jgi:hypothetical protein
MAKPSFILFDFIKKRVSVVTDAGASNPDVEHAREMHAKQERTARPVDPQKRASIVSPR